MEERLPRRVGRAASEPDAGREMGLCLGATAALVLATGTSEANASVGVGLIVLLAVPLAVGWTSGLVRGLVTAGICELMLIGFVQVGLGRLLFEPRDIPQIVLLCSAGVAGAAARGVRARRHVEGLAPVLTLPRRESQPLGAGAGNVVTPIPIPAPAPEPARAPLRRPRLVGRA